MRVVRGVAYHLGLDARSLLASWWIAIAPLRVGRFKFLELAALGILFASPWTDIIIIEEILGHKMRLVHRCWGHQIEPCDWPRYVLLLDGLTSFPFGVATDMQKRSLSSFRRGIRTIWRRAIMVN